MLRFRNELVVLLQRLRHWEPKTLGERRLQSALVAALSGCGLDGAAEALDSLRTHSTGVPDAEVGKAARAADTATVLDEKEVASKARVGYRARLKQALRAGVSRIRSRL